MIEIIVYCNGLNISCSVIFVIAVCAITGSDRPKFLLNNKVYDIFVLLLEYFMANDIPKHIQSAVPIMAVKRI